MTSPEAPDLPKWVFWSTRESIDNDIPSVTAIAETVIAIPLYWWIAIYFETYLPLLISAAVAPLVLLRSDQSVAVGVKWFRAWDRRGADGRDYEALGPNGRRMIWALGTLLVFFAGLMSFLIAQYSLAGIEGWAAFWRGLAIEYIAITVATGAAFAAGVAGRVVGGLAMKAAILIGIVVSLAAIAGIALTGAAIGAAGAAVGGLIFVHLLTGLAAGVLAVSLLVRIGATARYITQGFLNLPRNFRRLAFCTSPWQAPELVPGLPDTSQFTLAAIQRQLREVREVNNTAEKFLGYLFLPSLMLVWFLPGWLYRVTLKSTAWFWWPLAYLGGDVQRAKNPDEFRRATMGTLWAMASIALAAATIVGFAWVNIGWSESNPLIIALGYIFLIKQGVPPWQTLTVILAVLSLAIVFLIDDAGKQYRLARKQKNNTLRARAERKLRWTEYLARFRFVLLVLFLVIAGGQALLYLNSRACLFEVPALIEPKAQWLYGYRMPRRCPAA